MLRWLPIMSLSPALLLAAPAPVALSQAGLRVEFDPLGAMTVSQGDEPILRSGEHGLWRLTFHGDEPLTAAEAERVGLTVEEGTCRLRFDHPRAVVEVTVAACELGFELRATVSGHATPIAELALPGRLRFAPGAMQRLIVPANGNMGVGMALNRAYFERQPLDRPTAWETVRTGDVGYRALFGDGLDQREDVEPRTPARVTAAAAEWLPEPLRRQVDGAALLVNRPSKREQVELVLVDSADGPWFAAGRLGGEGYLWRFGGRVESDDAGRATQLVAAVVDRLPARGGKLGLLALRNGPVQGLWSAVEIETWRAVLRGCQAVRDGRLELVELDTAPAMMSALAGDEFAAIINPYGEGIPSPDGGVAAAVAAVGRFVRAGGSWFEVGGYPFFAGLTPAPYLSGGLGYPPAFCDFLSLETPAGAVAVSRVQPRTWEPWAGAVDPQSIFLPARLAWGGDEQGGWFERAYTVHRRGPWTAPPVRITAGETPALLRAYAAANQISGSLEAKVGAELWPRLRDSVLLYYAGNLAEKEEFLDRLPVPTLIHFADYLKGGFDKEYPDHLPPHPNFGTQQAFAEFSRRAEAMGHIVMPYTNPTWWCEDPRGPTFIEHGDAPLLRRLDGSLSVERYAQNSGYTITFWHPAVQAANRRTVDQFLRDVPVSVQFQDQSGARGFHFDANPASPTADAYTEGLLSQVAEDSARVPLSTEGGWDQVARYETQLCGMAWDIVIPPTWTGGASLLKERLSPELWTVYPVAQYLAHEPCMMLFHDLGQFVTDPHKLTWALGLGFSLSMRTSANALDRPQTRHWIEWLARLQKSVVARYLGQPVIAFEHVRPQPATVADDGWFAAQYGPVRIVANLGPVERTIDGTPLPPFGFRATADGLDAGYLLDDGRPVGYVVDGDEAWAYAPPSSELSLPLRDGPTAVRVPATAEERVDPPAELAGRAPRDWPGERPRIGVLQFAGWNPTWSQVPAEDWLSALRASALVTEHRLSVEPIADWATLEAALRGGPRGWLAIVNPYGEAFCVGSLADYRAALGLIREYVRNGGSWCEVGGHSFYTAREVGGATEVVGPRGIDVLGVPVGPGEVEAAPEPLTVTADGRRWLGEALSDELARLLTPVNRGLPGGALDPGHLELIAGRDAGLLGAYRLGGWGYLWRLGGMNPNPQVGVPALVAVLTHLYEHPAEPPLVGRQPVFRQVR